MTKTVTIETKRNSYGHAVRIQKRGNSFDVIYNSNGITWTYKAKQVSEESARNSFALLAM
jgi:hypothetical protein